MLSLNSNLAACYGGVITPMRADSFVMAAAVWQRNFTSTTGTTIATYDASTKTGNVWWAGEPKPAPTPAPAPTPNPVPPPLSVPTPAAPTPAPAAFCIPPMQDTGVAHGDLGNVTNGW